MVCAFGSATGKAESIAEQIVQSASGRGLEVGVLPSHSHSCITVLAWEFHEGESVSYQ